MELRNEQQSRDSFVCEGDGRQTTDEGKTNRIDAPCTYDRSNPQKRGDRAENNEGNKSESELEKKKESKKIAT
jgi:hypothetical protein